MLEKKLAIWSLFISLALALSLNLACRATEPIETAASPTRAAPLVQQTEVLAPSRSYSPTLWPENGESALVTRVIDGDTVEVSLNGESRTVRYIGIDTPETKHPSKPIECFGPEASQFNKELVAGRQIILEKDITDKDRYGRLLRYVWIEGVGLVNQILVENGYGRVSTYPPDVKYESLLIEAESSAQADGIGRWGACSEPRPSNTDEVVPGTGQVGDNCSPYYPTLCIPPLPPDLDCRDISGVNFQVLPPDPHRLDGDKDGIGCEG